jgi:hypothetical protein
MNIWGFLVGLIIGIVPLTIALKLLKGRRFLFQNPYLKGAVLGVIAWLILNLLLYIEASYEILGILRGEEGYGTVMMVTSSLQGFITAGIAAAVINEKVIRKR